jgi:hypothetical protein
MTSTVRAEARLIGQNSGGGVVTIETAGERQVSIVVESEGKKAFVRVDARELAAAVRVVTDAAVGEL